MFECSPDLEVELQSAGSRYLYSVVQCDASNSDDSRANREEYQEDVEC